MRANPLRAHLQNGGVALNGWLHIPSTWSAEVMAHAGWDSLTIDLQHGFHSIETAIQMLQVISTTATVPLARVNWNEPGSIMRLLDAGAYGIICPMISTRAECEAFVGACRYPPQGYRSLGPTRARLVAGADYADHANSEILAMAMVETAEAVAQIDAIADVPGLDMIFIGPGDLRLSLLAQVGAERIDDVFERALDAILASCARYGLWAGTFTFTPQEARAMIARGFQLVTVKSDSTLLSEYAQQMIAQVKMA